MRVLVCGGREFANAPLIWRVLNNVNAWAIRERGTGIRCLIDGAQQKTLADGTTVGADYWANQWAKATGTTEERYPADWKGYGRSAGPKRNQRMLDEGKPDLVIAFPGGRGTADMIRRAKTAGVPVREVGYTLNGEPA